MNVEIIKAALTQGYAIINPWLLNWNSCYSKVGRIEYALIGQLPDLL